jgi:zinc/manganese transport system ATP-binding protein
VTDTSRQPALVIENAAVSIRGRVLWSALSITIERGEFVAILGPNGVGKSTLLKAILGIRPLTTGRIVHAGSARSVGYLPQRRGFDPSLRVRGSEIVRLGVDGTRYGPPLSPAKSRAVRARVDELIELVDARAFAHRPIGQLSGGEQQRLLIAQALAHRPHLLLLDEPLDSLDLPNQRSVAELIARLCRDEGVAVLMVAHDVNPIVAYLDRVVYLAPGGAAAGTVAEVINSETLTALYRMPIEVLKTSDGRLVVVGQPEAAAVHADRHEHPHGGH